MGRVYLVGAGPGDPDLITVRGHALLQAADVVIYDALVGSAVLQLIPERAQKIYVGKRRGNHTFNQEEIIALLMEAASQHRCVVRLKGGDPFIFGRGGEEVSALTQAGIAVEVIPGVTAGSAVPALVGIPLTHRDYASSVTFVTGHEAIAAYTPKVNWRAIATATDTLVIYMGLHQLPHIVAELKAGGLPGSTPIALIQQGTLPNQHLAIATLDTLPNLDAWLSPTLIVIGSVIHARVQPHLGDESP